MSNRNLLRSAFESLKVGQPIRLAKKQVELSPPKMEETFSKISSHNTPLNGFNGPLPPTFSKTEVSISSLAEETLIEKTDSKKDSVNFQPGQNLNESPFDSVKKERSQKMPELNSESVSPGQRQNYTVSELDPVKISPRETIPLSNNHPVDPELSEPLTESKIDSVQKRPKRALSEILKSGTLKPKDHYSAIPNTLLREAGLFENPTDFMIYLSLFSHSYGFGRNTCDMGLTQLIQFTSLSRNSVRGALERLQEAKWIKAISEFEYGGISRKWRVFCPWEKGCTEHRTYFSQNEIAQKPESKNDSVKSPQSAFPTESRSNSAPPTGSKSDPYKDSIKENIKKSLSPTQEYFENLKSEAKRIRERSFFEELKKDFSENEISEALAYLNEKGDLRTGQKCHSPMAYLSQAISEVLAATTLLKEKRVKRDQLEQQQKKENERIQQEDENALQEWERAEIAFKQYFPTHEAQSQFVQEFSRERFKNIRPPEKIVKRVAIMEWHKQFISK